jgi:predicted outer membrane repeat protein
VTIQGPQTSGITLSGGGVTGVLSVTAPAAVSLVNLTITDGFDDSGGGILSSGTLTIDHSAFIGNEVVGLKAHGGAIYSTGPILSITNSTLSGNHARNGGAIMAEGDLTIRHTTITGNTAGSGAGLWASGELSLRNTIIAGNIDPDVPSAGENCQPGLGVPILSGVNLSDDASCAPAGPSMLIANPTLAALAHNGGPTQTHALLAGSPAIDGATLCTLTDDQRYVARPQGGACDIGAYEFDTFVQIGLTVDAAIAVDATTGAATLTGSVTCSAPSSIDLALTLTQVQKAGRLAPVVNATATATVACTGTAYWTAVMTPPTGAFQNGAATVDARTTNLPSWIAPAPVTGTVKLVKTKK